MPACELCGKETQLQTAIVEGTKLAVCAACAKMGRIIEAQSKPVFRKTEKPVEQEAIEVLANDYGKKIREARERKGLTQKEFAMKLNEKESIIQKIENETFKPTIEKAKKLEKILGIKLVEQDAKTAIEIGKMKSKELTIGDIISARPD